ncbi:MAG: hypothetical protein MI784_09275 [Cytophagales bacterium]|nr:hypothetical protein [Cytophagales bacterium]
MQTQYGVIRKKDLQENRFPECFRGNWQEISRADGAFLCIHAFSRYIQKDLFLHVFQNEEELEAWRNEAVDKRIERVEYDWENGQCIITIKQGSSHKFALGPGADWTAGDCRKAVESLRL